MRCQDCNLRRIVRSSPTGEIHVAGPGGATVCTSGPGAAGDGASDGGAPAPAPDGARAVEHPIAPRASDGTLYKYVTAAGSRSDRVVRVGLPIDDRSLVSPGSSRPVPPIDCSAVLTGARVAVVSLRGALGRLQEGAGTVREQAAGDGRA